MFAACEDIEKQFDCAASPDTEVANLSRNDILQESAMRLSLRLGIEMNYASIVDSNTYVAQRISTNTLLEVM